MSSTKFALAASMLVACECHEFVRGNDTFLLERFMPMVREQDIALDLRKVERIDAAGLAALIQLYCAAHDAGRTFTISNPSPRVAEILSLVGLDRLLLRQSGRVPQPLNLGFQETAA
jgi:anti-anti-sigma factor